MIQISKATNFTNASQRARNERMLVTPAGFRRYFVTNRSNGNQYEVFFSVMDGKKFGACSCPAGYPMNSRRAPQVCKHLFAATVVHVALCTLAARSNAGTGEAVETCGDCCASFNPSAGHDCDGDRQY